MKANNHRSQYLADEGCCSTSGELPERNEPMLCCPLIDDNGSGRDNLRVMSCERRSKLAEHRTCYGSKRVQGFDGRWSVVGCRGKRPKQGAGSQGPSREARAAGVKAKGGKAAVIAEKIIELYPGKSIDEISTLVGRCPSLVKKRLRDAGLLSTYNPDNNSNRVRLYLLGNPGARAKDISEKLEIPLKATQSAVNYWKARGIR